MAIKWKMEVKGLREVRRQLREGQAQIYGPPVKDAMKEIGEEGEKRGRAAAPVAGGALRGSIIHRVQDKPLPLWVAVRATAKARSGAVAKRQSRAALAGTQRLRRVSYSYPRRLEYDASRGHEGWLRRAIGGLGGAVQQTLSTAARKIERRFGH
jgi:hypothetical protein